MKEKRAKNVYEVFNNPAKFITGEGYLDRFNLVLLNDWEAFYYNPSRVYLLRLMYAYSRLV